MLEIGTSGLMSGEGKPPAASRSRFGALPRLYSTQAAEKKFEYMLRRELEAPLPQECLDIMAETRAALRAKWEANRR
jgi:hypothetical protein